MQVNFSLARGPTSRGESSCGCQKDASKAARAMLLHGALEGKAGRLDRAGRAATEETGE